MHHYYYTFFYFPKPLDEIIDKMSSLMEIHEYKFLQHSDTTVNFSRNKFLKDELQISIYEDESPDKTKLVITLKEKKLRHGVFRRDPNPEMMKVGSYISDFINDFHLNG